MYFEDYSETQQKTILNIVIEQMKEEYPDYKENAKTCRMPVDDWLRETAYDYINCNNRPNEFSELLK